MVKAWLSAVVLLAVFTASACYKFAGSGGFPSDLKTVAILPFDNQTPSPEVQRDLNEALRKSFHDRLSLRDAPEGVASLSGLDVADLPPADRRALFAYAAQDVRLMEGSVRENLLLAGPADDEALWAALDDAGLAEWLRARAG